MNLAQCAAGIHIRQRDVANHFIERSRSKRERHTVTAHEREVRKPASAFHQIGERVVDTYQKIVAMAGSFRQNPPDTTSKIQDSSPRHLSPDSSVVTVCTTGNSPVCKRLAHCQRRLDTYARSRQTLICRRTTGGESGGPAD